MRKKKIMIGGVFTLLFLITLFILSPVKTSAVGWVSEKTNQVVTRFNEYPIQNYALDYYVDTSWDWLPWQWGEGFGNQITYALFSLANILWQLNAYLSYFVGFVVEKAFSMDFFTSLSHSMATNIQNIAGVSKSGFMATGLFPYFTPIIILLIGAYVVYLGVVKKQVTRAIQSFLTFVILFVCSIGFVMNADGYLTKINDFNKGLNEEVLQISKKITYDGSKASANSDGVTAMRENLFDIQIRLPYLLLQYGESDEEVIGQDRINDLLKISPIGKDLSKRDDIAKKEVETYDNSNMSITQVGTRLGLVLLVLVFNLVIDFCVLSFTGIMLTSSILLILYLFFIPVSLVAACFPNSKGTLNFALGKVKDAFFTKGAITLILSMVFAFSGSLYALASSEGYIWVMFCQIFLWVIAYSKVNDFLRFASIGSGGDNQIRGGRFGRMASNMLLYRATRGMFKGNRGPQSPARVPSRTQPQSQRFNQGQKPILERMGSARAKLADIPNQSQEMKQNAQDKFKNAPTNLKAGLLNQRHNYDKGYFNREQQLNRDRVRRQTQQMRMQERRQKLVDNHKKHGNQLRDELNANAYSNPQEAKINRLPSKQAKSLTEIRNQNKIKVNDKNEATVKAHLRHAMPASQTPKMNYSYKRQMINQSKNNQNNRGVKK